MMMMMKMMIIVTVTVIPSAIVIVFINNYSRGFLSSKDFELKTFLKDYCTPVEIEPAYCAAGNVK